MAAEILYSITDGVATIILNRAQRRNAVTQVMQEQYFDALERADADPAVRAILVTGAGDRAFSVGADMQGLQQITQSANPGGDDVEDAMFGKEQRSTAQIQALRIRKPIVCAINGSAAGIGLVFALMADVRFVARGAKLTTAFAKRGLVAEHGCSWLLPRVVGVARALDLLLSSRIVRGAEAKELGLANFLCEDSAATKAAAHAYACDLAANVSPASMAAIKRQVYEHADSTLQAAYDESSALMLSSFAHPDFTEGVESFVERRQARYPGIHGDGTLHSRL